MNKTYRHAYLIIAHNNYEHLKLLISAIDDERNDIYIHIDKKAKDFSENECREVAKKSRVFFTERIKVGWGGFSQIRTELLLLEASTKEEYAYYHLLSGNDFPLKKQDEIHSFLSENNGKEFITVNSITDDVLYYRIGRYRFLQEFIGNKKGIVYLLKIIEEVSLLVQKVIGINRYSKYEKVIYRGLNWFSITHNMALYILEHKDEIHKFFSYSRCADELFLQTLAMRSPYKENVTGQCLLYTDWERGDPYTFTEEDYELLRQSDKMFARKFDYSQHPQIVDMLFNSLHEEE